VGSARHAVFFIAVTARRKSLHMARHINVKSLEDVCSQRNRNCY